MRERKTHSLYVLQVVLLVLIARPSAAFHGDHVTDARCDLCGPHTYCLEGEEYFCPVHSLSERGEFPSELSDCVCVPGYLQSTTDHTCADGQPPQYYHDGLAHTCPGLKLTTVVRAESEADCVCDIGYFALDVWTGACQECQQGAYNPATNSTVCLNCPVNSFHELTRQTERVSCLCDPGFTGADGGPCAACEGGEFKGESGDAACGTCAEDTFSNGTAAVECVGCAANSVSGVGSVVASDCKCNPGFAVLIDTLADADEHGCEACAVGFAKSTTENEACTVCGTDQYAEVTGLSVCRSCGSDSTHFPTAAPEKCLCDPGFFLTPDSPNPVSADECVQCAANTFKPTLSNPETDCLACADANMVSAAGSDDRLDCRCKEGFAEVAAPEGGFKPEAERECVQCAAGTYKDFVGSGEAPSACLACPANTISPEGSTAVTQCVCQAGFEGTVLGAACTPCQPGFFKAGIGTELCQPCPVDTFENETASVVCQQCQAHSTAPGQSDSIADCVCAEGMARLGTAESPQCVSCAPGQFSDPLQNGACFNCSFGTFSTSYGVTVCTDCPENSESYFVPRTACQCDKGYKCASGEASCDDGVCAACDTDTFKDTVGGAAACTACQENSESLEASVAQEACECSRGFEQDGPETCVACEGGEYSDELDTETCTVCKDELPHTYTPVDEFPYDEQSACTHCTLCAQGSFFDTEGGCGGVDGTADITCQTCLDAGLVTGAQASTQVATYAAPNQGVGSCLCNAGYTVGNTGSVAVPTFTTEGVEGERRECSGCEIAFFREGLGVADCAACAALMTTPTEATTVYTDCVCRKGVGLVDAVCASCLADEYKPDLGNVTCRGCWPFSGTDGATGQTTCQCKPGHIFPVAQQTAYGNRELDGLTCEACTAGRFSPDFTLHHECSICGAETYSESAAPACLPCPANSSTNGEVEQGICSCNTGFQRYPEDAVDPYVCRLCEPGFFKTDPTLGECLDCKKVCAEDERVARVCTPFLNMECEDCQDNSNKASGLHELGPCDCNAGFELIGEECSACAIGKARSTDSNNTIPCRTCEGYTHAPSTTLAECLACTPQCPTLEEAGERQYVVEDCRPEADIVCAACTVCPAGQFADPFCGPAHANGRNDTVCTDCPPNTYCVDQMQYPCTANSFSAEGNADTACRCKDGYHRVGELCVECGFNNYCYDDQQFACPSASITHSKTSSHRLDCQCHRGHYRYPVNDELSFTCAECKPDDYCFNNTHNNCSDDRMSAPSGSWHISNCTCEDGFYNNEADTECLVCPVDHYCFGGHRFECAADRWTQNEDNQERAAQCVCRPGTSGGAASHADPFQSAVMPVCQVCPPDSYCLGTDNTATACPDNSTTQGGGADERYDCKCEAGLQPVNLTLAGGEHRCEGCPDAFFKTDTGNVACGPCTYCSASLPTHLYTRELCTSKQDAVCEACDPCGPNGTTFIGEVCQDFRDTICSDCKECDLSTQWVQRYCTVLRNQVCANITTALCTEYDIGGPTTDEAAGYYRGQHTENTDSFCAPCLSRHQPYFGYTLHRFSSAGQTYNDPYSCQIECLGASKRRDVTNASLGCETCEEGNVLLKTFTSDGITCASECRPGYVYDARYGDCVVERFHANYQLELQLVNYVRYGATEDGWRFSLYHSNHSRYAVVVGADAPADCASVRGCCWGGRWRVSTLAQMGATTDACSHADALAAQQTGPRTLSFDLPDSRLEEVASCADVDGARVCSLAVTIIDTVRYNTLAQRLTISTRRGVSLIHVGDAHEYIPLQAISVVVLPLLVRPAGTRVVSFTTTLRGASVPLNVTLRVRGMSPYTPTAAEATACQRLTVEGEQATVVSVPPGAQVTFTSVWEGTGDIVHGLYALETLEGSIAGDIANSMDIAAVRNVSGVPLICASEALTAAQFDGGVVYGTAGLGAELVYGMRRLRAPTTPLNVTHGQLGNLLSFYGQAATHNPNTVRLRTVLAAYSKDGAVDTHLAGYNATRMVAGELDFTNAFRQWCQLEPACEYEYVTHNPTFATTYPLSDCSTAGQAAAVAWLKARLGVLSDLGHVAALCARKAQAGTYAALPVMVHTMAYLNKQDPAWRFQTPGVVTRTFAWAVFGFEKQ